VATLLVIEADATVRAQLTSVLSVEGYAVLHASDAHQARLVIERGRPDLILLGLSLPGTHGIELLLGLRDRDPHLLDRPVVACAPRDRLAAACEQIGTHYTLAMPFDPEEVVEVVRHALAERRVPQPPPSPDAFVG
jgi:DNA-binding response OmpR family regulator